MKKSFALIVVIVLAGLGVNNLQKNDYTKTNHVQLGYSADQVISPTKPSEIVELANGQEYVLAAQFIKKTISGKEVTQLGYNGTIPGPLIKVKQGSEVKLKHINNTDTPSTIHSHGVRLANVFDGVPDLTQQVVNPGGSFRYTIKFPDPGIYWYHPHVREDYAQDMGLYGNFLVVPTDPVYWSPVNREIPIFLDDILLDANGIEPFNASWVNYALMGRFGNTFLVNGETDYIQTANTGDIVRFFITNSANTRVFNFRIPGVRMKLVGGDNGRVENESFIDSVILSPSERAVVEVEFNSPGRYLLSHTTPDTTYTLGTVEVGAQLGLSYTRQFDLLRRNPDFDPIRQNIMSYLAPRPSDKSLDLGLDMLGGGGMMGANGGQHMMHNGSIMSDLSMPPGQIAQKIEWEDTMGMMNAMSNTQMVKWQLIDSQTRQVNTAIGWKFNQGDMVKIKLFNDPASQHPMQHPIHIHGQRFVVLTTNGSPNTNFMWKDTALIQTGDTVELLVDMSNPGKWMIHCHISEHLESGMMLNYEVL